ncbi:bZIP transcription factor (Fcr3) [Metarhizium album ARSEF 1941]|uniref:BZIP transcription factor (Fcr3) n=1 Tax=Metarhizium album (strain ARSEF 1941) TaxID=1081103 RepID=A0A0B2WXQ7_METAS|nr:bZIP transcription factor (Fcr3) [Metarhizium album ARSEF 1941]KHN98808.1 bZIP transcription factor (Fcr3) [Metarhizium album ARSEF 1941]
MDFSSQPFPFTAGQPYHQSFMSVPPLTPSNSHSTGSDDYNTASPPRARFSLSFLRAVPPLWTELLGPRRQSASSHLSKVATPSTGIVLVLLHAVIFSLTGIRDLQEVFDSVPNPDQFRGFEYNQGFHNPSRHQTSGFPGPPTPPNPATYPGQQPTPQLHHQASSSNAHLSGALLGTRSDGADDSNHARVGSDEDDSLTPAQSRRKAQNRAAQRAFRERKEKHVKDLEAKLAHMEAAQQQASVENERLKRDLQKVSTENEILRATSSVSNGHRLSHSPEPTTTGPMKYNPTDFYSNVLQHHQNKFPSHRIVTSDDGERLLAAGATWDFIINHDLYKRGLVDVGDVSERLKSCALCDGQGPVFSERSIVSAMEQSVASGTDDLL